MLPVFNNGGSNWRLKLPDRGRWAEIRILQRDAAQATVPWGSLYSSRLRQWYHAAG